MKCLYLKWMFLFPIFRVHILLVWLTALENSNQFSFLLNMGTFLNTQ